MNQQLDEALVRDFPLLYADRHASVRKTPMGFGFDCGDGWEPLIRDLSAKLEPLIAEMPDDPDYGRPRAAQVKEKFGTLRFYMTTQTQEMDELIHDAEARSALVCEECGQPGRLVSNRGWLRTACPEHTPPHQDTP